MSSLSLLTCFVMPLMGLLRVVHNEHLSDVLGGIVWPWGIKPLMLGTG